ncbi:hypothetical protein [Microcoleus sp. S13_B4]|uniref:hypothetical protein n=1 Tax=Microcoleus sp. S13_B4 TaxID=3055408 RepID=UPI002FD2EA5A
MWNFKALLHNCGRILIVWWNWRPGASHFCSQARNWSFEAGGRTKEEEGRSQKKCFYKYEMLPDDNPPQTLME